jgi:hypothetical protein
VAIAPNLKSLWLINSDKIPESNAQPNVSTCSTQGKSHGSVTQQHHPDAQNNDSNQTNDKSFLVVTQRQEYPTNGASFVWSQYFRTMTSNSVPRLRTRKSAAAWSIALPCGLFLAKHRVTF